jgi:HlyD family secretion protein
MKKYAIMLIVVLAIAAGTYFAFGSSGKDKGKYVTEAAATGDITASISATGKLNPKVSVLVGTEVSGTIREIMVDYNSPVKKGQVLVKLDQDIFRTQVDQARAKAASAKAHVDELVAGRDMMKSGVRTDIDQKKANFDKASADFKRREQLFSKGMISREELDASQEVFLVAQSAYAQSKADSAKNEVTDAQINSAKADYNQARASLQSSETNLSKTVIKAPMDGVVIDKPIEVGQTVAASFNTPNLLQIGDLGVMQVEISIDEADVGQTKVGQKAQFTVDAFPQKVFEGTLSKIYNAPVTVQNVVTYTGIVEVKNPGGLLRPGMTANVKVITSEKEGVLSIPNAALRVKVGDGVKKTKKKTRGTKMVWVLRDGKPASADIVTGVTDLVNTEVISGLKPGDKVLVESPETDKTAAKAKSAGGGGHGGPMRGF